jgi:hypothetical protein
MIEKTLPNTQETIDLLSTLPKLYVIGLFCYRLGEKYGIREVVFAGEYIKDENSVLEVPLVYDLTDNDTFVLKPVNKIDMDGIVAWEQDEIVATAVYNYYEEKRKRKVREQRNLKWELNPIVCIETNTIFPSYRFVEKTFGFVGVQDCLLGKKTQAGGYHWRYATEKDLKNNIGWEEIYTPVKIQCVETGEIFASIKDAFEKVKQKYPKAQKQAIKKTLKHQRKHAYGYSWRYYKVPGAEDYNEYPIGETLEDKQHYFIRWMLAYKNTKLQKKFEDKKKEDK